MLRDVYYFSPDVKFAVERLFDFGYFEPLTLMFNHR